MTVDKFLNKGTNDEYNLLDCYFPVAYVKRLEPPGIPRGSNHKERDLMSELAMG